MEKMRHNIACSLEGVTNNYPNQAAVVVPHTKTTISFKELNDESSRIASGLKQYGFQKGDCVLLLIPFSIRFISIVFALFKAGTVPVLIDPGLGKKNILNCIKESEPQGVIATPMVHFISKFFQNPLSDIKLLVTTGSFRIGREDSLKEIKKMAKPNFTYENTLPNDPAAILFTSGSTGSPKGVLYTHEMFSQQLDTLRSCYNIQPGGIDLSTFPLFSLFGIATGMTSILPDMNFTKPAKVNPKKIINTIIKHNISSGFGSPALWDTISRYCISKNRHLPSISRILMAGAPIPGSLLKRFDHILKPESKIHTPYGATEALPVTTIERKEILGETFKKSYQGYGTCVGRAVSGMELRVIKITDTSITQWDDSLELTQGEIGEIVVKSTWTTQHYFKRDQATSLSKIKVNKNLFWHRMGDVGYIDEQNRLWFCGRKSQRIQTIHGTLFTVQCEGVFNAHPKVKRSALVGVGKTKNQRPIIIVELEQSNDLKKKSTRNAFIEDLFKLGNQCGYTRKIKDFLIHKNFPVDIRHNAKISRELLAEWAIKKLQKIE
jgi:olefin beta-lactone synthetase